MMPEETERKRNGRFSDIGDWIARVGVPAAIAFFLLFQTNQKLDALTSAVNRLVVIVEAKK